jgi:hypothetical protein
MMKRFMIRLAALLGLASVPAAAGPGISREDREDISVLITQLVWGGFDTRDDIRDAAIYQTQPPVQSPADLAWIDMQIAQEWSKKRTAEATWPTRTDFDRLDDAFKALDAKGVLALHNAGNTQSDAHGDAGQVWHDRGGRASGLHGYIYYHGQDLERVVADGQLYIGFGVFEGAQTAPIEIARIAADTLKATGFTVVVPSDDKERISITGIDWKKRSPE